jgi:hypothetical protein
MEYIVLPIGLAFSAIRLFSKNEDCGIYVNDGLHDHVTQKLRDRVGEFSVLPFFLYLYS